MLNIKNSMNKKIMYYLHLLCILLLNTQVHAGNDTVNKTPHLYKDLYIALATSAYNMEDASNKQNNTLREYIKTNIDYVHHDQERIRLYLWYDKYIYTLRLTGAAALAIAIPTYKQWPPLHTMPRSTPPRRAGGFFVAFGCIWASIVTHWARTKSMLNMAKESYALELKAQTSKKNYKNASDYYTNKVKEYNHAKSVGENALKAPTESSGFWKWFFK